MEIIYDLLKYILNNAIKLVNYKIYIICSKNIYFIFSDAKNMARDVHNILLKVVMEKGKMSELDAANYIKKMDSQKRYSSDVWS